jgi:hypothetical protein
LRGGGRYADVSEVHAVSAFRVADFMAGKLAILPAYLTVINVSNWQTLEPKAVLGSGCIDSRFLYLGIRSR